MGYSTTTYLSSLADSKVAVHLPPRFSAPAPLPYLHVGMKTWSSKVKYSSYTQTRPRIGVAVMVAFKKNTVAGRILTAELPHHKVFAALPNGSTIFSRKTLPKAAWSFSSTPKP